ncbi:MAG: AraC family transcriptional regulator [Rhizobium sp.]|uniref:helix-turn-helix transcriptional regulator n=1 Tax=Rhizobium/Agrobacterium group TaxID=227290 RepID=UPI00129B3EC1|nr:AraC family transcriptional regulator [Agrobacterium sp. MA01]MDM7979133.1 AraC family transcriptional regulator [Rhizobium sp.]MDM8015493.1 AraC family transcriptional regulator [Rhizobium sp.]QGG89309.1 helix-turn-helix domain-containing protein [Agrobacterium sp. MA01]
MTYLHSMQSEIEGIRALMPPRWRSLDGVVGVHWEAEGHAGANGYYLSPDPRIVFFFNDVSSQIRVADRAEELDRGERGMARAIYVPAGMPMWTKFSSRHRFSHLDLHLHQERLMRYLTPAVGSSAARAIIRQPVELQDPGPLASLATLVVDELSTDGRHPAFAENLVGSIITGLLDLRVSEGRSAAHAGHLTKAQLNRLSGYFANCGGRRLSVREMADVVGLSESWFATVFRQTTDMTPLQWQLSRRIDMARQMLSETEMSIAGISAQLGFSDQAHLTKVFRSITGETPAVWRRKQQHSI